MPNNCCIPDCLSGRKNYKNIFKFDRKPAIFSAPKDPVLFELWAKVIESKCKKLIPGHYVCELHFREDEIDRYTEKIKLFDGTEFCMQKNKFKLKKNVVPSIFTNVYNPSNKGKLILIDSIPDRKRKIQTESSNCNDDVLQSKENCLEDFASPPNSKKLKIKTEPQIDRPTLSQDNHYKKDCPAVLAVNPTRETHCTPASDAQDTTVNNPDVVSLESLLEDPKNALYKVFFSSVRQDPKKLSLSKVDRVNTYSKSAMTVPNSNPEEDPFSEMGCTENIISGAGVVVPDSVLNEQLSFNFLKVNVGMISSDSPWWKIIPFEDFLLCARFTSDYKMEKKIVINQDLSVKVFLNEKETELEQYFKIDSVESVSKLIHKVDNAIICPKINKNEHNCDGFLQSHILCKRNNLCLSCIKTEREKYAQMSKSVKEEKKNTKKHVELLRFHLNI